MCAARGRPVVLCRGPGSVMGTRSLSSAGDCSVECCTPGPRSVILDGAARIFSWGTSSVISCTFPMSVMPRRGRMVQGVFSRRTARGWTWAFTRLPSCATGMETADPTCWWDRGAVCSTMRMSEPSVAGSWNCAARWRPTAGRSPYLSSSTRNIPISRRNISRCPLCSTGTGMAFRIC